MATKKSKNPVVATTAGAVAGAVETVTIWPMEMIKTNMQLGTMRQHYTGMLGGFQYHIRTDGPISLYRGLAPVLIGSIPKAGIRFGAFDYFKHKFMGNEGETPLRNLAAGMCAGALEAVLATTPIETIKTKLIGANEGVWKGTKRILATEGIGGMYKGVTATVLKQSSNQGLRFMWFTEYKNRISPQVLQQYGFIHDANNMTNTQHACYSLVGGITAGIFSVLGNNPFDVVKTRMQGLNGSKYKNTFDCVQRMVRKDGFMVLYSGVIPRLGRVIPGQGVIFMTYDAVSRLVSSILEKDAQKKLM